MSDRNHALEWRNALVKLDSHSHSLNRLIGLLERHSDMINQMVSSHPTYLSSQKYYCADSAVRALSDHTGTNMREGIFRELSDFLESHPDKIQTIVEYESLVYRFSDKS